MKGLYIPIILALTATLAATAPAEAISSKAPQQAAKNQRFIKMQQEQGLGQPEKIQCLQPDATYNR